MAYKLFETKPKIKLLISTEECPNLKLIFHTTIIGSNFHSRKHTHAPFLYLKTIRLNDELNFAYQDSIDDSKIYMNFQDVLTAILQHLNFNYPQIYWYVIN